MNIYLFWILFLALWATVPLMIIKGRTDESPSIQALQEVKAKKKDWRTFTYFSNGFTVMPSTYLNKVDGAGFIEKYDFSFMPGSGPYAFDKESSKKGSEGYIVLKRRNFPGEDLTTAVTGSCTSVTTKIDTKIIFK